VGIHAENAGTLSLRSNELNGLENYNVTLKDKMTNTVIDLKKGDKLAFSTSAGEFEDRFVLTISNITTGSEEINLTENPFNICLNNLNIVPLSEEWSGKSGCQNCRYYGKDIIDNRNVEFWKTSDPDTCSGAKAFTLSRSVRVVRHVEGYDQINLAYSFTSA
jgi:hypothetical protein